ncbi:uncharacterized protein LOC143474153 [Brachyhypopomus gauderio]|uniref:uncharacterized protein LOC143474153 n=1 Tax=Brachyhypopomus gauderio TaxID=698409 RepID=UPI0040435CE7
MHTRLFSLSMTGALLMVLVQGDTYEFEYENDEDVTAVYESDDFTVTPTPDYTDYTFEYEEVDRSLNTVDYSEFEVLKDNGGKNNRQLTRAGNKASGIVYRSSAILVGLMVQQFCLQT